MLTKEASGGIMYAQCQMKQHNYYVYITTNPRRTVLYTGVTNDLIRRMAEHFENKSSFAGKYLCYNLIYYEQYLDIRVAIAREKQIKGWTRDKKEALISELNPSWKFLNKEIQA
jgi:putative endonuclease